MVDRETRAACWCVTTLATSAPRRRLLAWTDRWVVKEERVFLLTLLCQIQDMRGDADASFDWATSGWNSKVRVLNWRCAAPPQRTAGHLPVPSLEVQL